LSEGEERLLEAVPGVVGIAVRPQIGEDLVPAEGSCPGSQEQREKREHSRSDTRRNPSYVADVEVQAPECLQPDHRRTTLVAELTEI
jgi:hypothetical protein